MTFLDHTNEHSFASIRGWLGDRPRDRPHTGVHIRTDHNSPELYCGCICEVELHQFSYRRTVNGEGIELNTDREVHTVHSYGCITVHSIKLISIIKCWGLCQSMEMRMTTTTIAKCTLAVWSHLLALLHYNSRNCIWVHFSKDINNWDWPSSRPPAGGSVFLLDPRNSHL